jgi:hypothetical protein
MDNDRPAKRSTLIQVKATSLRPPNPNLKRDEGPIVLPRDIESGRLPKRYFRGWLGPFWPNEQERPASPEGERGETE